jgi:hypothetical protein
MEVLISLIITVLLFGTLMCWCRYQTPTTNVVTTDVLHISKTGGTSIKRLINNHKDIPLNYLNHETKLADTNPDHKVIAVIRNPEDRFISAFWFAKKGGFRRPDFKTSIPFETLFDKHPIHNFSSPTEFLDALEDGDLVAKSVLFSGQSGETRDSYNIIYQTQSSWFNSDRDFNLLCFDNLNEEFEKYLLDNGINNYNLSHHNKSIKKSSLLTNKNKQFLKKMYTDDYRLYDLACSGK